MLYIQKAQNWKWKQMNSSSIFFLSHVSFFSLVIFFNFIIIIKKDKGSLLEFVFPAVPWKQG